MGRQRFTPEFKDEAVRQVTERGRPVQEVADRLGVTSDLRQRGFGRQMMEAAEDKLRELGCPKINLQVRSSNQAVIDSYAKLGYGIEERVSMGKLLD